jgi:ABC-2 type transport system ATP-binding protein
MSIQIEHLSKSYGHQLALDDISFSVNSGEIVGLIGPNGAGKSTMMKIICSLLLPASGEVKINGISVVTHAGDIKQYLGYLPENNPLYTDMYVREYLQYVAGLYQLGEKTKSRINEVIDLTGLKTEMHKKIAMLSKGYRQRVGLAQAIIHNPDILILDEPTTGLDPNQIAEIRNLISQLGKEKTVILSTHIMQEVEAICQRVIILNKGCLVANDLTGNLGNYSTTGTQAIVVEFDREIDQQFFKGLTDIIKIRKFNQNTWILESSGEADIRGKLFKHAVNHNLIILSLHKKDKKLEDVFRDLTS